MDFQHTKVQHINSFRARAGGVGEVGDPNTNVRLRRSSSEMDPIFIGRLSRGSNITDGNNPMAFRKGAAARVHDDSNTKRTHYMQNVTTITDKIASERLFVPKTTCGLPQLSWRMQKSSANPHINQQFIVPPGGFGPKHGQLRRGPVPLRTLIEPF